MAGEMTESTSALTQHGYTTIVKVLRVVHFYDAWVLFFVFIVAFVTNSILSAEEEAESEQKVLLGPGGKPLPMSAGRKAKEERAKRKKLEEFSPVRKLVFLYLSVGLLFTYLSNGAAITLHVLTNDTPWWCGKSTAVSSAYFPRSFR
jgi:thiosulfate reductase cytochrome b subunit